MHQTDSRAKWLYLLIYSCLNQTLCVVYVIVIAQGRGLSPEYNTKLSNYILEEVRDHRLQLFNPPLSMANTWSINLVRVYQLHLHFTCISQIYYPIEQPVAMAMGGKYISIGIGQLNIQSMKCLSLYSTGTIGSQLSVLYKEIDVHNSEVVLYTALGLLYCVVRTACRQ